MVTYETSLTATKIITAFLTAGLAIVAVYLEAKHGGTHKGKLTAFGAILMLLVNIISTALETKNNNTKAQAALEDSKKQLVAQKLVIEKLSSILMGVSEQNTQIKESINKQDITLSGIKDITEKTSVQTNLLNQQVININEARYQIKRNALPIGKIAITIQMSLTLDWIFISHAKDRWDKKLTAFLEKLPKNEYQFIRKVGDEYTEAFFQPKFIPEKVSKGFFASTDAHNIGRLQTLKFDERSNFFSDVDVTRMISVHPLMPMFEISFRDVGAEEKRGVDALVEKKAIMLLFYPFVLGKNNVDELIYYYYPDRNEIVVNAVYNNIKIPKKEKLASLLDLVGKTLTISSSYKKGDARFKNIFVTFYKDEVDASGRSLSLSGFRQLNIDGSVSALYKFKNEDILAMTN